jgi:hypothetical protein
MHGMCVRFAAVSAILLGATGIASAQFTTRFNDMLNGNFVLIGNTLGFDAAPGVPIPVVGTVGATGINTVDSAPDVLWRSNSPGLGHASANTSINVATARSQAMLQLPPGATVRYARLYWSATVPSGVVGTSAILSREGVFSQTVSVQHFDVLTVPPRYQSSADITTIVQANGAGAYQLGAFAVAPFVDVSDAGLYAAWSMVVVYERAAEPLRSIAVLDGYAAVALGSPQSATVNFGASAASSGFDGRLGVVAYEGDNTIAGDQVFITGSPALSDGQNPSNNAFNGTRSFFGAPFSVPGDLPQLTGTPASLCGVDIDIFDITTRVMPGAMSAGVEFTSTTSETFDVGVLAMAVRVDPPPACPGDASGNGSVGLDDIAEVVNAWGQTVPPAPMATDLDGSGDIGLGDIAVIIQFWGLICP